jgi:hypothetical protein
MGPVSVQVRSEGVLGDDFGNETSLVRLAMSRASCPVASLAEAGEENTHAEMPCSSIY